MAVWVLLEVSQCAKHSEGAKENARCDPSYPLSQHRSCLTTPPSIPVRYDESRPSPHRSRTRVSMGSGPSFAPHVLPCMIAQLDMESRLCLTECSACMLHVLERPESAPMHPCETHGGSP